MPYVVHKFDVTKASEKSLVKMPLGSKPLHVDFDPSLNHYSALWALVDPAAPLVEVWLGYVWTGKPVPPGVTYVGSHIMDQTEMRHVFIGPLDQYGKVTAPDQVIANSRITY